MLTMTLRYGHARPIGRYQQDRCCYTRDTNAWTGYGGAVVSQSASERDCSQTPQKNAMPRTVTTESSNCNGAPTRMKSENL